MFQSVAAFELRYQLKSPAFWVTFAIFLLLTFAATASDNVQIGSGGNVWKNSPYAIAQTLMIMTVFSVFILTAFVANVVVRDDETGFGPIIHSTRLSRFDYLFGRFTGALLAGCLLFLSAPLGMILGAAMPWLDPEVLGPFNLWHYAYVYLLLCVPTLFVTGAGFFAIATATRSMMWTYVGVIVFLVLYLVATGFLSRPEFINTVALVDPFGLGAYDQATRYWTAAERNTQIPEFAGYILWNRVLWVGVAFALLGLAWAIYARAATGGRMAASNVPDKTDDDAPVDRRARRPRTDRKGETVQRCGLESALGARPVRHGCRHSQPRLHRPARHRLRELAGHALVRRREVRQHDPSRHADHDRSAARRLHDHSADHRDLLRG